MQDGVPVNWKNDYNRGHGSPPEWGGVVEKGGILPPLRKGVGGVFPPKTPPRSGGESGSNLEAKGGSGGEHLFRDLETLPPGEGGTKGGSCQEEVTSKSDQGTNIKTITTPPPFLIHSSPCFREPGSGRHSNCAAGENFELFTGGNRAKGENFAVLRFLNGDL